MNKSVKKALEDKAIVADVLKVADSKKDVGEKLDQVKAVDKEVKEFEDVKFIKKHDTCCIVGFAPSWSEAPYDRRDVDFWGINELYVYLQKDNIKTPFAAWFEIHNILESPSKQSKMHQNFLMNCKIPLITQQHWDKYPSSMAYPRKYVKGQFNQQFITTDGGAGFSDYSNQIAWMIALAIQLGYKTIMVYGVDMAQETEYAFQRASCQFFLGYAAGAGISLKIPSSCQLLKAGADYGFKTDNKNRFTLKTKIKENQKIREDIATRNAELMYGLDAVNKELEEFEAKYRWDKESIKQEMNNCDTTIKSGQELLGFVENMPDNMAEIKAKVPGIVENIRKRSDEATKVKQNLDKELKMATDKINSHRIGASVKKQFMEIEHKKNELAVAEMQGSIQNCKHLINNNLV